MNKKIKNRMINNRRLSKLKKELKENYILVKGDYCQMTSDPHILTPCSKCHFREVCIHGWLDWVYKYSPIKSLLSKLRKE